MIVLGIESSCDETGVGIIRYHESGPLAGTCELLADEVASSVEQHARFGGVVPEIASRAHLEAMVPTMRRALQKAGIDKPDAIAVTIGPGLAGALMVGVSAAKAYAVAWGVPLYAVNHLGGHIAVDTLEHGPMRPCVALLVSGGHTHLLKVDDLAAPIVELGSTIDDAAGEAFDKVARLLGLGYPGGPQIDRIARDGDPNAIAFPRALSRPGDSALDFSFSGLKTAVARHVESTRRSGAEVDVPNVAASFQEAVADVLTAKMIEAVRRTGVDTVVMGGGATANSRLRELAEQRCAAEGVQLRVPAPRLCTDNGVMIATFGAHLIAAGAEPSDPAVSADPGLPVSISRLG